MSNDASRDGSPSKSLQIFSDEPLAGEQAENRQWTYRADLVALQLDYEGELEVGRPVVN